MYNIRVDLVMYYFAYFACSIMSLSCFLVHQDQDASFFEKVLKVEFNASQIENQRLEP